MSAERQAAIRDLMRAAERVLDVCGREALDEDATLAPRIVAFAPYRPRARVIVDLALAQPMVTGELVRDIDARRFERLAIFELYAAPADAFESGLH